jgi:tetratricopeptide (TPR) repeat protein
MSRLLSLSTFIVLLAMSAQGQQENLASVYADARAAQAAGQNELAAKKYEQITRMAPNMAEAFANLGNVEYELGRVEPAAAAFRKAISLKPQLTGPHFFLGVIEFHARDYEKSLRNLESAEKLEPANPLVQSYLGYVQYARRNYSDAVRHLESAEASQADDPDILYHLSKAYAKLAAKSYAALHQAFRDSLFDDLALAHAHEAAREWEPARDSYRRALAKQPGNVALTRKVQLLSSSDPAPQATGDDMVDGALGLLYLAPAGEKLNQEFQRLLSRRQSSAMKPSLSPEAAYSQAETYQALAYLAALRVVDAAPDSYRAHQLKGQSLEDAGNNDEAIAEYRAALEKQPELPTLHFAIGNIYWKTNRLADALPELEKEVQVDPNNPQALYELGDVLADSGNQKKAEQCFLNALRLDSSMVEPHLALEKLYTAQEQYAKSLHELQAAASLDAANSSVHYRMAAIYRKLGKPDDAERELALFRQKKSEESGR